MLMMCKETPVAKLKAISGHMSAGTSECHKNSPGSRSHRRDLSLDVTYRKTER